MYTQNFTVINSQVVTLSTELEVEGVPVTASFVRTVVEADAAELGGRTLTLVLPAEAAAVYPEGTVLRIDVQTQAEYDSTHQEPSDNG